MYVHIHMHDMHLRQLHQSEALNWVNGTQFYMKEVGNFMSYYVLWEIKIL